MEPTSLSGLYVAAFGREELRLDVDGRYPQLAVSGTIDDTAHWLARLKVTAPNRWAGEISYTDGATSSFAYTSVDVRATSDGPVEVDFADAGS
jgi:hypothetical protein